MKLSRDIAEHDIFSFFFKNSFVDQCDIVQPCGAVLIAIQLHLPSDPEITNETVVIICVSMSISR